MQFCRKQGGFCTSHAMAIEPKSSRAFSCFGPAFDIRDHTCITKGFVLVVKSASAVSELGAIVGLTGGGVNGTERRVEILCALWTDAFEHDVTQCVRCPAGQEHHGSIGVVSLYCFLVFVGWRQVFDGFAGVNGCCEECTVPGIFANGNDMRWFGDVFDGLVVG